MSGLMDAFGSPNKSSVTHVTSRLDRVRYASNFQDAFYPPKGTARVKELTRRAIISLLAALPTSNRPPSLRLLYCHYVFDDQVKRFETTLRALLSLGDFVDSATLIKIIAGTHTLTRDVFHLSFDDGFKNVISNAMPILRRYGIPAIFFVPTSQVLEEAGPLSRSEHSHGPRPIEMATWYDLERAASLGFEIGSHTRRHARLSGLSMRAMEDEIYGSREDLIRRLGRCRYISWPYGRSSDVDVTALSVVEKAGYEACFGAFRSRVLPGITSRFRIPRHHFEVQWPITHIQFFARGGLEKELS